MGLSENILDVVVIVILPLIPAFILYKWLPPKKTIAKGPFKGLNIQLTGSFAGYFIVLLFISGFFLMFTHQKSSLDQKITEWEVEGVIKLEQEDFNREDLSITIAPPELGWGPEGIFYFSYLPISKERKEPTLMIRKAGYQDFPIMLKEYKRKSKVDKRPDVTYDKDKKLIKISQITLKRKGESVESEQVEVLPLGEEK